MKPCTLSGYATANDYQQLSKRYHIYDIKLKIIFSNSFHIFTNIQNDITTDFMAYVILIMLSSPVIDLLKIAVHIFHYEQESNRQNTLNSHFNISERI